MTDLRGKKIGLSKSLNTLKNDWCRVTEEQGIELMLRLNGMTRANVEIVEFPYSDDWYGDREMLVPFENPTELGRMRDHEHDLSVRPRESALEKGAVDAIYSRSKYFQHLHEATGKFKAIEDFMFGHGYIKNDFEVHEWAAPEFLEQAARELIEEQWKATTAAKRPSPSTLQTISRLLG